MRTFPLPGTVASASRDVPAEQRSVRDAATVMLVRDGARGVEVFVFRRVRGMAFAAGMVVFPGGVVDPADRDPRLVWAGGPPGEVDPAVAVAAVRETFEECGVLLARVGGAGSSGAGSSGAKRPDPEGLARRRADLLAGRTTLADVLLEGDLVLDATVLHPWAHWLTPAFEPRRYDTRFFVARVPDGQEPHDLGGEGENARWVAAADALAQHAAGTLGLMPPTQVCLEELAAAGSTDALFATVRTMRRVTPWLAEVDGPDGTPRSVLRVDLDGTGGAEPGPPDGGAR